MAKPQSPASPPPSPPPIVGRTWVDAAFVILSNHWLVLAALVVLVLIGSLAITDRLALSSDENGWHFRLGAKINPQLNTPEKLSTIGSASAEWVRPPLVIPNANALSFDGPEGIAAKIENWVNNVCKPDAIGDLFGFISQGGQGQPWDIQIFCQKGTAKLGKITVTSQKFSNNDDFDRNLDGLKKHTTLLGFYYGSTNSGVFLASAD